MLHVFVNDRKLGCRMMSQLLKMRAVITHVAAVGDDVGTTNVVLLPREDIRTAKDECLRMVTLFIRQIQR